MIPKQSDWSIMMSNSEEQSININNFATLILWHLTPVLSVIYIQNRLRVSVCSSPINTVWAYLLQKVMTWETHNAHIRFRQNIPINWDITYHSDFLSHTPLLCRPRGLWVIQSGAIIVMPMPNLNDLGGFSIRKRAKTFSHYMITKKWEPPEVSFPNCNSYDGAL